jgi:hypothetical protein
MKRVLVVLLMVGAVLAAATPGRPLITRSPPPISRISR